MDMTKKVKVYKKQIKEYLKDAKKLIKEGDYNKAADKLKKARISLEACRKMIIKTPTDQDEDSIGAFITLSQIIVAYLLECTAGIASMAVVLPLVSLAATYTAYFMTFKRFLDRCQQYAKDYKKYGGDSVKSKDIYKQILEEKTLDLERKIERMEKDLKKVKAATS